MKTRMFFTICLSLGLVFCLFTELSFGATVAPKEIFGETFPENEYHYATMFGGLSTWVQFPSEEIAQKVGRGVTGGSTLTTQNSYDSHRIFVDQVNDSIVINASSEVTFLTLANRHGIAIAYATLLPPFELVMSLTDVMRIAVPAKPLVNIVFPSPFPEYFAYAEIEILEIQGEAQTNARVPVSYNYSLGAFVSWFTYQVDLNPYADLTRDVTIKSRLIVYNESREIVSVSGVTTDAKISETVGGELILIDSPIEPMAEELWGGQQ